MGQLLFGMDRMGWRQGRSERFVADNDLKAAPKFAPYAANPWTTSPTEKTEGFFGVDADGFMDVANGEQYIPVVGKRKVFAGAAKVLTAEDAGAICRFSTAAGYLYTLPAPQPGLFFEFHVDVTITSVGAKILTNAADVFLGGWFRQSTDSTYTMATHAANGTDIRSWNGNGSTTGGILGDVIYVVYEASNIWRVWGWGSATGAEASPFATS